MSRQTSNNAEEIMNEFREEGGNHTADVNREDDVHHGYHEIIEGVYFSPAGGFWGEKNGYTGYSM